MFDHREDVTLVVTEKGSNRPILVERKEASSFIN